MLASRCLNNMDSDKEVKINQGDFLKSCVYCEKPMIVAHGNLIQKIDKDGRVISQLRNRDQTAIYHEECRKEGRRMTYKHKKELLKVNK